MYYYHKFTINITYNNIVSDCAGWFNACRFQKLQYRQFHPDTRTQIFIIRSVCNVCEREFRIIPLCHEGPGHQMRFIIFVMITILLLRDETRQKKKNLFGSN